MQDKTSFCAYIAAALNFIIGLSLNDIALIVGISTAVFTAWANWHWKQKDHEVVRKANGIKE